MTPPRRIQVNLFTPAELTIYNAVIAVEAMPADVRLTDAVILLQAARDSVADYVDGIENRRFVTAGPPQEKEICICAAIKLDDGTVLRGHRHDDCFQTAQKYGYKQRIMSADQGFVTSRNRFVDRVEGMTLQRAAGLTSAHHPSGERELHGDMLFSEDLYSDGPSATCGHGIAVDEDGCCRTCGTDATVVRAGAKESEYE